MTNSKGQSKKSRRPTPNTRTKGGRVLKVKRRSLSSSLNNNPSLRKNHQVPRKKLRRKSKLRESKGGGKKAKKREHPGKRCKKSKLKKKTQSRS
jgi:hypothetical protein